MPDGNPYSKYNAWLSGALSDFYLPSHCIGILRSKSPFAVDLGDHTLSGNDLLVNYDLIDHEMEPGDRILLLQSHDGQTYIAVCKVVKA